MGYLELNVLQPGAAQPALGIDLGTTNSLAAIWRNGRPEILHAEGESGLVPSVIHFPASGPPMVGREARSRAVADPLNTIFSIKRFMGRGLSDVKEDLETLPYRATETERKVIQIDVRGHRYTPPQLSALILEKVRDNARRALGQDVARAVITVPAYFDDTQRQATRAAAWLAGLEVLRIINEPTAASLAYGLDGRESGNVAVYDLGGGTFDVSILSIAEGVFRVLSTAGDTHLGGDDFDRRLAGIAAAEIGRKSGTETLEDPGFRQAIRLAAERSKIELSQRNETEMHLALPELGLNWRRNVTRAEFEEKTSDLVERTIDCCRRALSDARLGNAEINEVVLVGGSSRIPAVRRRVEEFFGRKPHTELNPDEVVALGAAVQAHILTGGKRDMLLLDVTPLSLGIETMGGAVAKIIQRNATIPCHATEGFTTYVDDQTGIDFNVVQGEREMAKDCRSLGRFQLKGIPPMPAGMARVDVRFHIDADGLLTVSAKEQKSGQSAQIEVQPMHGLTDSEVETMLQESYAHAKDDFEDRHLADVRVEIGIMVRATERNLATARRELDRESIRDLEEALQRARAVLDQGDLAATKSARDALEQATLPLAALLMDSVAKQALSGKRLDEI